MNFIVFSGPPSSGKTSVILKTISALKQQGISVGVVKFDCLHTDDDKLYEKEGVLVRKGLSGALCPDHFFASNIEEVVQWGNQNQLDLLITESAGLCNRCSPYLAEIKGVCIIDNLSGINTPRKIGPMLKSADFVVITKGDIVSQAEREVFAARVTAVNPKAVQEEQFAVEKYTKQINVIKDEVIIHNLKRIILDEELHVNILENCLNTYQ